MGTMPPPMPIPCIRVDGQADHEVGQVEDLRWSPYDGRERGQAYCNPPPQERQYTQGHQAAPQPPFKLVTDLSHFNHPDQFTLERYVEDQFAFHVIPQSAPVRELSPFDGCGWVPESVSAITQYHHDRLSSPDDTILSSASGSNYWPGSNYSSRFDGVSCSSASQGPDMSRRGSAFGGSISAASDPHDPFAWQKNETVFSMPETQTSQPQCEMTNAPFAYPTVPSSRQTSRHATPFNTMFSTDMELDCSTRASSIPPPSHPPSNAPMRHSHPLSATSAHASFRYPSPHAPIRHSLTPSGDSTSDFDHPKSDNEADSDYIPNRSLRSPRCRPHRQVRSATHIRSRPAYNAHARSSSYNTPSHPHRVTKPQPHARHSSTHLPHFSPKPSRHTHAVPYPAVHPPTPQPPRPFTCPLTPYACPKTFTSKNEWKRHVLTQHLLLGFWRCDLCPDAAARPNDFNRKDLFVQHLRRMHCGDRRGAATVFDLSLRDEGVWVHESAEQALERVRRRCWIQLRTPPRKLACCFCAQGFASSESSGAEQEREKGCAVEWLEHVGRHLVGLASDGEGKVEGEEGRKGHKRRKSGSKSSDEGVKAGVTEPPWEGDGLLLEWLVEEGLVERSGGGGWVLVDRGVASEAAIARREERDAEGDVE